MSTKRLLIFVSFLRLSTACFAAQGFPTVPHVDFVAPLPTQPHEESPQTIWFDDFNKGEKAYAESKGRRVSEMALGGKGSSLEVFYPAEKKGGGSADRKVFFGDCGVTSGRRGQTIVRGGETFDEVYVRVYVKHQRDWQGGQPDKFLRATSLVGNNWAQAMIAHVWGGGSRASDTLTLDPVRLVEDGQVRSARYNDWKAMKWLGNSPGGTFPLASSDWWVAVEMRVKLNTPGKSDGENQLWVDGRLDAERKKLNFRGTYTGHGINAVFLESYWNKGAPTDLTRWYDNFVVSAAPIGPVVCPPNPQIFKTPYGGAGTLKSWELKLASDVEGKNVVFVSHPVEGKESIIVATETGNFCGTLAREKKLNPGAYWCRVRQQNDIGNWSEWSAWHQYFKVE